MATVLLGAQVSPSGEPGPVGPEASIPSGTIVQVGYAEMTTELVVTAEWPSYATHNIGGGTQVLSLSFTPKHSNSKLLFRTSGFANIFRSPAYPGQWGLALFRSGITAAIAVEFFAQYGNGEYGMNSHLQYMYTPGDATARTYSLRAGAYGANTSIYLNGYTLVASGMPVKWTMTIEEIKQ